jgi:hypothetical protein
MKESSDGGFVRYEDAKAVEDKLREEIEGISTEVLAFAKRMQYKLDKNKHKSCIHMNSDGTGRKWADCNFGYLTKRIAEEADELKDVLVDLSVIRADPETDDQVIDDLIDDAKNEAADVANFAMMIFDNVSKQALSDAEGE